MDGIHSDDGRTVEKLGRDPWLHTDWQGLFERVAGSSEPPLQRETLVLAITDKYGCSRGFAETIIEKAADHGQLLYVRVHLDNLTWHYYIAESNVISDRCNWVSILLGDILVDRDTLAVETVSKGELVEQLHTRDNQLTRNQAQHIVDYIEFFAPFYTDSGDLKLHPEVAEDLLMSRSHDLILEAVSFSTPTTPNEALVEVMEVVSDYNEKKKELYPS